MQPLFAHFAGSGEFQIVTGGVKHVIFWKLAGGTLSPSKGIFGKVRCCAMVVVVVVVVVVVAAAVVVVCVGGATHAVAQLGEIQPIICAANVAGKTVTGAANGHLYVWEARTVTKRVVGHVKAINCMFSYAEGFVTGSKDGMVRAAC